MKSYIVNYVKILSCVGFLIDTQKHTFCKFPSKEHFSQEVFQMFQWFKETVISKLFSVGSYVYPLFCSGGHLEFISDQQKV